MAGETLNFRPSQDWAGLTKLADRLGVEDVQTADLLVETPDGRRIDVLTVLNAFLDRVDEVDRGR